MVNLRESYSGTNPFLQAKHVMLEKEFEVSEVFSPSILTYPRAQFDGKDWNFSDVDNKPLVFGTLQDTT